ncbi:MAG: hypothetical protein GY835_22615 [bacterium]|nr:hypothetical protein [bacterium]
MPSAAIKTLEGIFGVTFNGATDRNTRCPFHEDETSQTPSCSVTTSGAFKCHGCGASGNAAQFYAKREGIPLPEAYDFLKKHKVTTLTSNDLDTTLGPRDATVAHTTSPSALRNDALEYHAALTEYHRSYLRRARGLDESTTARYLVGHDGERFTLPVFAERGISTIRRYHPEPGSRPKMVNLVGGDNTPALYPMPITPVRPPYIIICEGEFDALLLRRHGFPSITHTGGCQHWNPEWTTTLADLGIPCILVYDMWDADNAGQLAAKSVATDLARSGVAVGVLELPLDSSYRGGDITDYFISEGRTPADFQSLLDTTLKAILTAPDMVGTLTLHAATDPTHINRSTALQCTLVGRTVTPYVAPKKVKLTVKTPTGEPYDQTLSFLSTDPVLLKLISTTDKQQLGIFKEIAHVPRNASMDAEVLETWRVEEVLLSPSLRGEAPSSHEAEPYTLRQAYVVQGPDAPALQLNSDYNLVGRTLPHPRTQQVTHLIHRTASIESALTNFTLTAEQTKALSLTFQPTTPTVESLTAKLADIATYQSHEHTHIYARNDLHTAIDLVYHSPLRIPFADNPAARGWLDVMILGDTRTGKGCVAEGLANAYQLGSVISGEHMTLAGLVGGLHKVNNTWTLVWGKLPTADQRLVILDECSALTPNDFGRLSRIRSEGIAEITKIITESTHSRTRLLWLANPRAHARTGHASRIEDFPHGIEALTPLVGAPEDIARFDFVLVIGAQDVDAATINRRHQSEAPTQSYPADLARLLILWAWSRTPKQVTFASAATDHILDAAQKLGALYSPKICLVQVEDARFKLARIAAAAAARTYSISPRTPSILRVKLQHAQFAVNFLHHVYSRESSAYYQFSQNELAKRSLRDPDAVATILQEQAPQPDDLDDLIEGFLSQQYVGTEDIEDWCGADSWQARSLISQLVRQRALEKAGHRGYTKRPAFRTLLITLQNGEAS